MRTISASFFVTAVFLAFALPGRDASGSNAQPLRSGDAFPQFSGRTLAGKSVMLPNDAAGRPVALVFSFSRKAAGDAHLWSDSLSRDAANPTAYYGVILLESAPKMFQKLAVAGMRSVLPASAQQRTIVLLRGEELWRRRLGASYVSRAYVLLLGPHGEIRWRNSGPFSGAEFARLKAAASKP